MLRRLARLIAASILTTLVVVPVAVRAQQRLRHNDLGQHDPIPTRVRLSWNSWAPTAKLKAEPPDAAQRVSPALAPTAGSAFTSHPGLSCISSDHPVPHVANDRSPRPLRGPPAARQS
jgi:hypothetical protein